MKKIILTLVFASAFTTLSAQTEEKKTTTEDFNKWSVELAGGFNKTVKPMTDGYATGTLNPYTADLGIRYMFNNKFGLKVDFGYNSFSEKSDTPKFDTKYYRADLQAVANLGRIMSFDTWTNTFGLLGHTGFGVSQFDFENSIDKSKMVNFIAGLTGQIKLSNRIALTGDFSTILNGGQKTAFDGASEAATRGFNGVIFNGTVGLTVYLGKNAKHADWVVIQDKDIVILKQKVADLETMLNDTDRDGVADYLDAEPNTITGVMVDTKGRSIDNNNNNIPDELEGYLAKTYLAIADKPVPMANNELIKKLINGGYVSTYFDFNKATPTNVSTEGIDFILTYLRNNPTASIDIIGHADELGRSAYNDKLSTSRANNVKNVLVKANIDASRLNVVAAGEDTSVLKDSDDARKLVRRVTFMVK